MLVFIAGASSTGARVAVYSVDRKSVRDAVREFADDVGGRRGDDQQIDRRRRARYARCRRSRRLELIG